jgi:hypothetical protein
MDRNRFARDDIKGKTGWRKGLDEVDDHKNRNRLTRGKFIFKTPFRKGGESWR